MLNVPEDGKFVQIVFCNDNDTPWQFVIELLTTVFDKTDAEAKAFATTVDRRGHAVCGIYPPETADTLVKTARSHIDKHDHSLKLTAEPIGEDAGSGHLCAFCGEMSRDKDRIIRGDTALICSDCIMTGANFLSELTNEKQFKHAHKALAWHFAGFQLDQLATTSRQFTEALEDMLFTGGKLNVKLLGGAQD